MSFTKSIGLLSVINLASVVVSLAYTLLLANLFGVSREVEVFFAASQVFTVFVAITQAGQLTEAFIPIFHRVKANVGIEAAYSAFSVVTSWVCVIAFCMSLALFFLAEPFVAFLVSGFDVQDKQLAVKVVVIFAPLILLQVLTAFMKAMAHAQSLFGWPEALALVGSLMQLFCLLLGVQYGIWALVTGLIVSVVIQFFGMIILLYRDGFRYHVAFHHKHFSIIEISKRLWSTSFYTVAAQLASVVITSVLSNLPQGVYGAYSYALRMQTKISSVLLRPISLVFFTRFSEALAEGAESLKSIADVALNRTLVFVSVAIIFLFTSGEYLLIWVLWGDDFPASMISLTFEFLTIYVLAFLLLGVGQIARKILVSHGHFDVLYRSFAFGQITSAIMAYFLVSEFGVQGVYLLILYAVCFMPLISLGLLKVKVPESFAFYKIKEVSRLLLLSLLVITTIYLGQRFLINLYLESRLDYLIMGCANVVVTSLLLVPAALLIQVVNFREVLGFIGKR